MIRLAVTPGDPRGIGPEVLTRALCAVGAGDPDVEFVRVEGASAGDPARSSLEALERAARMALAGDVRGIVTGPVSKRAISELGVPFTGATEYLAALAGVAQPVMFFAGERLRVALVTTHAPLRRVPAAVHGERIVRTLRLLHEALAGPFGIAQPRLAVLGLNPHAGEGGWLGTEEIDVIAPAVEEARAGGVEAAGPISADTAFVRALEGEFDGLVAMYHDQALPAVKALEPEAVNVTLGLPFVRTAPHHGPAFDKAGTGKARWGPMAAALRLAVRLARPAGSLF